MDFMRTYFDDDQETDDRWLRRMNYRRSDRYKRSAVECLRLDLKVLYRISMRQLKTITGERRGH